MTDATLIFNKKMSNMNKRAIRYSADSVAASSTSDEIVCGLNIDSAKIDGFRIATNSTNYTVQVFTETSATSPTITKILDISEINLEYSEMGLNIVYTNTDSTDVNNLYLVLTNADAVNATGEFEFEFILDLVD